MYSILYVHIYSPVGHLCRNGDFSVAERVRKCVFVDSACIRMPCRHKKIRMMDETKYAYPCVPFPCALWNVLGNAMHLLVVVVVTEQNISRSSVRRPSINQNVTGEVLYWMIELCVCLCLWTASWLMRLLSNRISFYYWSEIAGNRFRNHLVTVEQNMYKFMLTVLLKISNRCQCIEEIAFDSRYSITIITPHCRGVYNTAARSMWIIVNAQWVIWPL